MRCRWCDVLRPSGNRDAKTFAGSWLLCRACAYIADIVIKNLIPSEELPRINGTWPRLCYVRTDLVSKQKITLQRTAIWKKENTK